MRYRFLLCAVAGALMLGAGPAFAARLVVTVDGLHSASGDVFIGLYASPAKFLHGNQTDATKKARASTGPITVVFDHLRPGTYAVGAFHDENGNDHLDTNFLGLPVEGYALSNNIRAAFSKPNFYQAAFSVGAAGAQVALHIRY